MTRIVFLYILSITKIFEQKLDVYQWLASAHQHHAVHGQKPIGCLFLGGNIFSGVCRNCLLSSFLLREEGEEFHRWKRITKGITCIKCGRLRINMHLRKNCACILRVRRPLISNLYCRQKGLFFKQDEPNPALWLVTQAGRMELSCMLRTTQLMYSTRKISPKAIK